MCMRDMCGTDSCMLRLLMLLSVVICFAPACCGPEIPTHRSAPHVLMRFERFREAAQFSLPSTQSWWFTMPESDTSLGDGARRVLLCGSDFRPPEGGERLSTYSAVCVWDFEDGLLPSGADLDRLSIPRSLGVAPGLGMSLLEAAGCQEVVGRRVIVENRFVVAASSEIVLGQALARRGDLGSLEGSVLERLPETSCEIVMHRDRAHREFGIACAPGSRSVLVFDSAAQAGKMAVWCEPMALDSGVVEGSVLANGWHEYRMPEDAVTQEVIEYLWVRMLTTWGAYALL